MIQDVTLRWVVTLLFVFSAGVYVQAIAANRHSGTNVIGDSLHAIMAVAMAVMAWPSGAELPTRAPMVFFAVAAIWFAVIAVRDSSRRWGSVYHALMMLAMAWMYAAMGGLPLRSTNMSGMDMSGMDMSGADGSPSDAGHAGHGGHGGHGGHAGHAGHSAAGPSASATPEWVGVLNWVCTVGFAIATVFWIYRYIAGRLGGSTHSPGQQFGILSQATMAAGMAIMFAVML
jgi:hypothetical protein